MNMKAPHPAKKARIEIIPLIDVIFFLLATFVLISLSMTRMEGERVKLPKSKTAEAPSLDKTVTLSVTKLGAIYWNKDVMNWDQFVLKIENLGQTEPKTNIMINADDGSAFGQTASVMDEVRKAGFKKVSIQTEGK
ncbi:MAG: biopolymer transporter ExbD [Verrucomicrobiota bacterium]|nr:biopolymer transporter ExbD [Verrucomicrobiota bacterium]